MTVIRKFAMPSNLLPVNHMAVIGVKLQAWPAHICYICSFFEQSQVCRGGAEVVGLKSQVESPPGAFDHDSLPVSFTYLRPSPSARSDTPARVRCLQY